MTFLRTHAPWGVVLVLTMLWALHERSGRLGAEARLEVEQALAESRQLLDAALSKARTVADAHRLGIEAARAVVEAVARAEEISARVDAARADDEERAIDAELLETGRVTDAAMRSWERWRTSTDTAAGNEPAGVQP